MIEPNSVGENDGVSDNAYWDDEDGSWNLDSEFSKISINYCTDLFPAADSLDELPQRSPSLSSAHRLPIRNILKTSRLVSFVKHSLGLDDKLQSKCKVQLGSVIEEFEKKLQDPGKLVNIFSDLYEICADSKRVTSFVQLQGHALLFEYFRRYIQNRIAFCESKFSPLLNDFDKKSFVCAVALLSRLSYFSVFRIAAQKESYAEILVEIFNPMNDYFVAESLPNHIRESQLVNLKKVAKEKRFLFLKRALPARAADYGLSVYVVQNKICDSPDQLIFKDMEKNLAFDMSFVENLYKSKTVDPKRKRIEWVQFTDQTSFWAVRKKDLDATLNRLEAIFSKCCEISSDFKPKLYQLVGIPTTNGRIKDLTNATVSLIRAMILRFDQSGSYALLFCVDIGYYEYLAVSCLKILPEGADEVEPAAFMCVLEDFVPYPSIGFSILVAALSNLCHDKFLAELLVRNEIFLNICKNVLKSTNFDNLDIFQDVSDLLLCLSNSGRIRTKLIELNFHELLFDLMIETVDKIDKTEIQNFVSTNLSILSNLALMNCTVRKALSEKKAIIIAQGFMAHFPYNHLITSICKVFLKNILTKKACTEMWYKELDLMCCRNCYLSKETIPLKQPVELIDYEGDYTIKCDDSLEKYIASDNLAKEFHTLPMNRSLINNAICNITDTTDLLRSKSVHRRVSLGGTSAKYLPQEYPYYVSCDAFVPKVVGGFEIPIWEVVSEESNLETLRAIYVQSYVCAALNSKTKLILYFGFSTPTDKNKRVTEVSGIRLNFSQRDNLRVGTDFALSKALRPVLQPELYDIRIVPVFSKRKMKGECIFEKTDSFIVEVHITNLSDQFYQLEGSGKIFVKGEDQTPKLSSFEECRADFVEKYEDDCEKRISLLKSVVYVL